MVLLKNRPLLQRKKDTFYVIYFISHFVISLLIDSTVAIPREFQLDIQKQITDYHVTTNSDILLLNAPVWLKAFVWLEIIFQVPFFLVAAVGLIMDSANVYLPCLIYGVEASITTYACLAEIAFSGAEASIRDKLLLIYLPTFVIPLFIAVDFYKRLNGFLPRKQKLT